MKLILKEILNLAKLDFKIDELKTILQNKPVSHLDFATDRTFIEPLIKIAKFLGVTTFK